MLPGASIPALPSKPISSGSAIPSPMDSSNLVGQAKPLQPPPLPPSTILKPPPTPILTQPPQTISRMEVTPPPIPPVLESNDVTSNQMATENDGDDDDVTPPTDRDMRIGLF